MLAERMRLRGVGGPPLMVLKFTEGFDHTEPPIMVLKFTEGFDHTEPPIMVLKFTEGFDT